MTCSRRGTRARRVVAARARRVRVFAEGGGRRTPRSHPILWQIHSPSGRVEAGTGVMPSTSRGAAVGGEPRADLRLGPRQRRGHGDVRAARVRVRQRLQQVRAPRGIVHRKRSSEGAIYERGVDPTPFDREPARGRPPGGADPGAPSAPPGEGARRTRATRDGRSAPPERGGERGGRRRATTVEQRADQPTDEEFEVNSRSSARFFVHWWKSVRRPPPPPAPPSVFFLYPLAATSSCSPSTSASPPRPGTVHRTTISGAPRGAPRGPRGPSPSPPSSPPPSSIHAHTDAISVAPHRGRTSANRPDPPDPAHAERSLSLDPDRSVSRTRAAR